MKNAVASDLKTCRRIASEIPPNTKKPRKEEQEKDRLSDLPDEILLHVLSFLNSKDSVQTCLLSKRWIHLWKHLPSLTLNSNHFRTLKGFTHFVSRILYLRDPLTTLHSLDFHRWKIVEPHILKRIVKYAISHNVQRLRISAFCSKIEHFRPCLISSQTLTSLSLSSGRKHGWTILFPYSLNLPSLNSLNLQSFSFPCGDDGRAEPFSALERLNSLILDYCRVREGKILCISSTTLVNLTIHMGYQIWDSCKFELSAPSLCSFAFTGTPLQKLCGRSNLSSIQQVSIDAYMAANGCKALNDAQTPWLLLNWLIELAGIKYLTISANTLLVLSLVPGLLNVKFPSLCNLKSLKIKKIPLSYELSLILIDAKLQAAAKLQKTFEAGSKPSTSRAHGIVNFLRQNSPSAKVVIVKGS